MQGYLDAAVDLLQSLITALVNCLSIPWVAACMLLVVIAFVISIFKRLT